MKITKEQIKNLIIQELKEAYGNIGPDDETEEQYHGSIDWQRDQDDANRSRQSDRKQLYLMNKEKFLEKQYMNWANEFDAQSWEEGELINKVLEEAYDKIGEAFELDGTGLYQ